MREIHLIPWGGLGNRFRAINGTIGILKDFQKIKIIVHWYPHKELNAKASDIIENIDDIQFSNFELKDWFFKKIIKWKLLIQYPELYKRLFKLFYDDVLLDHEIKDSQNRINWKNIHGEKVLIIACREIFPFEDYRNILFKKELIDQSLDIPPNTLGIHIRRGDHREIIESSPITFLEKKIEKEQKKYEKIYLATDDIELKKKIAGLYPEKIIIQNGPLIRNSKEGIEFSTIELINLSKCSNLLGDKRSSYIDFALKFGKLKSFINIQE